MNPKEPPMKTVLTMTLILLMPLMTYAAEPTFSARTMVNTTQFLAHMARDCSLQLQVKSRAGLLTPECKDFVAAYDHFDETFDVQVEALRQAALTLGQSRSVADQHDGILLLREFNQASEHIIRAMQHVRFLEKRGLK
jgi:hypothetical protein